jgi:hypothetical protein
MILRLDTLLTDLPHPAHPINQGMPREMAWRLFGRG